MVDPLLFGRLGHAKKKNVNVNVICLPTEHQGVHKNLFRNVRAFQRPVPERRNTSIPGINLPYFRDNFIPGINPVPERRNSAVEGINLG